MECPYCAHSSLRVTDKRDSPTGIRRRRECKKCKKRFTTYENIVEHMFYIIKKDKRREKFSREKLRCGIEKAFEKRPVSHEKIDKMINQIEEQLRKKGKKEIPSSFLGELIMKKIKSVDNVAYIRFASVYRDFQDLGDFRREIRGMN
ncbi:MAG: transcriptional regulator NrdR [Candidatus Pacearchaeota archaeon]